MMRQKSEWGPEGVKADYYLPVTLEAKENGEESGEGDVNPKQPLHLENLPCKIFLPRKHGGRVRLCLYLTIEHMEDWWALGGLFWRSSLYGELSYGHPSPEPVEKVTNNTAKALQRHQRNNRIGVARQRPPFWRGISVTCGTVYFENGPSIRGGISFQEITAILEPADIEIEEVLWPGSKSKRFVPGHFWLTSNRFLDGLSTRPKYDIYQYIGSAKKPYRYALPLPVEHEPNGTLRSRPAPTISLEQQINTYSNDDGDTVLVREQIMPFRLALGTWRRYGVDQNTIAAVDDWTLLASVGSRWPTTCLGWELFNADGITKHYRCARSRPRIDELRWVEQDAHYGLVDINNFEEFLDHGYTFLQRASPQERDVLRQVMERILIGYGQHIESSFLALYAALEMLVLQFRRARGLEFIFTAQEWKTFERDAKKFVKTHPITESDGERRKLLYDKGRELNRISFATAFDAFCTAPDHSVPIDDLWPVAKGSQSLSELRNTLVHGETFSALRYRALDTATSHLQWWVERMVLALIQWPLNRSMVAPRFLSEITDYNDWEQQRQRLISEFSQKKMQS